MLLSISMLAAFILVGCKSGTEETPVAEGEEAEGEQITVRYICLVEGIPYFDPIIEGMKERVEEMGGIFEFAAPEAVEATAQIPLIEAAIQDKVDVISISPVSPDANNEVLDKARENGIIVIAVNDDLIDNETHRDACILNTDYDRLAEESFEIFASLMDYKGKFVVLSATTEQPFQNNQIRIYKEMMSEDSKYKDMELLEIFYGEDEATKSLTESENAIQKYPDLGGIMAPTSVAIIAAGQAVENKGLQDKIVVYGTGTPNQCRALIKSGALKGSMLWDTHRGGEVTGIVAIKTVEGEIELEPGKTFEAAEYGETKINDNNVIYAGPPLALDINNIDDYDF